MKKRLRKKLRVGDFTEYGFEIEVTFKPHYDRDVNVLHDLVIEIVEGCGLRFGGDISEYGITGYIYKGNRQSCTDVDKAKLFDMLMPLNEIGYIALGALQSNW